MNLAPIKHGLAYRIGSILIDGDDGQIMTSQILWESEPVKISADDALAALAGGEEAKTGKAEAIDFLQTILANGSMGAKEVQEEARASGISAKSLRSARMALDIKPAKSGFGSGWVWSLPKMPSTPQDALPSERAPSTSEGTFAGNNPEGEL